jgi:hypothetical protein
VFGVDPTEIQERLFEETDAGTRSALIVTLGQYDGAQFPLARRAKLIAWLVDQYENEHDAGIHNASAWLLRKWRQQGRLGEIDSRLTSRDPQKERSWYLNRLGQTMIVIRGPVNVSVGSPTTEMYRGQHETLREKQIPRTFAVSASEVTLKQMHTFNKEFVSLDVEASEDHPARGVTWYEAAAYCNRLSEKEGIREDQWCYVPNANDEYADGMSFAPNHLGLEGYRLPTEAEWEFCCRAGTRASWFCGGDSILLRKYGWHYENAGLSTQPVALLKPNALGLFDTHGNALEWCEDVWGENMPGKDAGARGVVRDAQTRVARGGSFALPFFESRSASRRNFRPTRYQHHCFRIARTLPPNRNAKHRE